MYIYKITHKTTHQCYVGQTSNIFERWKKHVYENSSPIQKAITEEGVNNFTFEVLEICEQDQANERESYWIKHYHAYTEGYNTNEGTVNIHYDTPPEIVKKPKLAEKNRGGINSPDGVDAYDPATGQFVAHYNTIADANRAMGKEGTGNISAVCRGRGKTAYGFIWRYTTPQS